MSFDKFSESESFLPKAAGQAYPDDDRSQFSKHVRTQRWKKWLSVASHGLQVLVCILLAANLAAIGVPQWSLSTRSQSPRWRASDTVTMKYESAEQWMSLEHKYDHLWNPYEEGKTGLVRVDKDGKLGNDGTQWGALSMFHQLHCLASFRTALQNQREGIDIGKNNDDDPHWPHCFWYLRQAIHCAADATIELPSQWGFVVSSNGTIEATKVGPINGRDDLRTCGDADALYKLRAEFGVDAVEARRKWSEGRGRGKRGEI